MTETTPTPASNEPDGPDPGADGTRQPPASAAASPAVDEDTDGAESASPGAATSLAPPGKPDGEVDTG